MPELAQRPDAWLEVTTHPDAEIFLIGNDRQLIGRGVGRLRIRQPKGLYRLKVTRAAAAVERLVDLDQDLLIPIEVGGLDTVVPFIRTTDAMNRQSIEDLARGPRAASNVLLIGRMPVAAMDASGKTRSTQAQSPLSSVRLIPWGSARDNMPETIGSHEALIGSERWSAAGKTLAPGTHILEIDDGVRATRQAVLVLPQWQTRIFIRRQPPNAAVDPDDSRRRDTIEVALHLSRPNRPVALEPEFESSEIARLALAMGRRIISSRQTIDIFLSEKFDDPMAGIAAAHLMFDAVERAETDAKSAASKVALALTITDSDVAEVMNNLGNLLQTTQGVPPDLIALKLRANMPLSGTDRIVSRPPVYARSWELLLGASVGGSPRIEIDPDVFKQCAANFFAGAYFGWAPTSIANYVEHIITSNQEALGWAATSAPVAAAESLATSKNEIKEKILDYLATRIGEDRSNLLGDTDIQDKLGRQAWRTLTDGFNQTDWMKRLGSRLIRTDMDKLRTAGDIAETIWNNAARARPLVARVAKSVRRKTTKSTTQLMNILANDENRAHFADRLNIPRSVFDALLASPADQARRSRSPAPALRPAQFNVTLEAPQPTEPPSSRPISQRAFDMIVEFEVSSQRTYEQKYRRPIWPGVSSGVTIGIGYDVGYASKSQLRSDWRNAIPDVMIAALEQAVGVRGEAAKPIAEAIRQTVDVPWDAAIAVHRGTVIPRWIAVVERALPNTAIIGPDCLGALVSLTYNRGASYSKPGDRYKEMRAIKAHMAVSAFSKIPGEIRAMNRLWPDVPGLQKRREHEAKLFEDGLGRS